MLTITGCYAAVIGAVIWVTALAGSGVMEGWVAFLSLLQALDLLLLGGFRVESAVRGDVTSRMLESHRLMPAPPLGSILGYIFGAPLQAFLIAVVNFALGSMCCLLAGRHLDNWAMANGMLFLFAIFIYSMLVQFAFVARGGALLLLIFGFVVIPLAESGVIPVLPVMPVLLAPMLSRVSVFGQLIGGFGRHGDTTFSYVAALAGQGAIALIAIRVAIRRYLSSTVAGISAMLGLLLLLVGVATTVLAWVWPDSFDYHTFRSEVDPVAQTVVALCAGALLALVPIASAAWTARQQERDGDRAAPRRLIHLSEILTAIAATLLISALMIYPPTASFALFNRTHVTACTAVIVLNFLLSMAALFSWGYLIRHRAWVYVSIWIMITWLVPVVIDAIYHSMTNDNTNLGVISSFSPPAALALLWSNSGASVFVGIVGQIALGIVPTGILMFTQSRRRAKGR